MTLAEIQANRKAQAKKQEQVAASRRAAARKAAKAKAADEQAAIDVPKQLEDARQSQAFAREALKVNPGIGRPSANPTAAAFMVTNKEAIDRNAEIAEKALAARRRKMLEDKGVESLGTSTIQRGQVSIPVFDNVFGMYEESPLYGGQRLVPTDIVRPTVESDKGSAVDARNISDDEPARRRTMFQEQKPLITSRGGIFEAGGKTAKEMSGAVERVNSKIAALESAREALVPQQEALKRSIDMYENTPEDLPEEQRDLDFRLLKRLANQQREELAKVEAKLTANERDLEALDLSLSTTLGQKPEVPEDTPEESPRGPVAEAAIAAKATSQPAEREVFTVRDPVYGGIKSYTLPPNMDEDQKSAYKAAIEERELGRRQRLRGVNVGEEALDTEVPDTEVPSAETSAGSADIVINNRADAEKALDFFFSERIKLRKKIDEFEDNQASMTETERKEMSAQITKEMAALRETSAAVKRFEESMKSPETAELRSKLYMP